MLGALFALLSAATFGLNNAAVRRGVLTGSVAQAMAVGMPIGAVLFGLAALVFGQLSRIGEFSTWTIVILGCVGVLHFVIGRYCNYRAVKAVGANLSASIQQWTLLVSLVLAVLWLNESLTPLKMLGVVLVILGPTMALKAFSGNRPARSVGAKAVGEPVPAAPATANPVFEPNLFEGYVFSLLSTIGYGISPIILRWALEDKGLALVGGFISYAAAALVIGLSLLLPGRLSHVRAVDRKNLPWFTLSGVSVFVSQAFRYVALGIAPVIVVTPITRLAVVFRLLFSWIINRDYESFHPLVLWGVAVSFAGAMLLTIHTGFVVDHVPMPSWLADIVAWEWPGGGD